MKDNMEQSQQNNKASKDNLAILVGGLFVIAVVFAAYKYFNSGDVSSKAVTNERQSATTTDKEKGDLNGKGVKDEATIKNENLQWVATDYKKGDITSKTYTVKRGDTLWEIAEAVYGNGAEWTKILEANASSIGYLPNGSQALIVTGQTLILP